MSLAIPGLQVEIAVATMDLYPRDLPGRASWVSDFEQLVPYLEATRCRNFEVHPTAVLVRDARNRKERRDTAIIDEFVGSLHQTSDDVSPLVRKVADHCEVLHSAQSVAGMVDIQSALSRRRPWVQYPRSHAGGLGLRPPDSYPGSFPLLQLHAEFYRDFVGSDKGNGATIRAVQDLGFIGLCPDTVHARRKAADGSMVPPWWKVWADQFASGKVYQMHVGADRADMKPRDPKFAHKSEQEFRAFTSSRWQQARNTEMGDMIVGAIENWVPPADLVQAVGRPVLRMVIEVPPRPMAFGRRIAQHARFVENLAHIVLETGATPLLWEK